MKKTYSELLRDPRWQRKRLEILNRANFSCEECCDESTTLHVHHKRYRKGAMPWEYGDHELIALCETCHEARHAVEKLLRAEIEEMCVEEMELVLGFIQGRSVVQPTEEGDLGGSPITIRNRPHMCGVSMALGYNGYAYNQLDTEVKAGKSNLTPDDAFGISSTSWHLCWNRINGSN